MSLPTDYFVSVFSSLFPFVLAVYSRVIDKPTPLEQEYLYRIMASLVRHATNLMTGRATSPTPPPPPTAPGEGDQEEAAGATAPSAGRVTRLGVDSEVLVSAALHTTAAIPSPAPLLLTDVAAGESLLPATVTLALVSEGVEEYVCMCACVYARKVSERLSE